MSGNRTSISISSEVHREIDIESATIGIPIYQVIEKAWELYKLDKDSQLLGDAVTSGPSSALRGDGERG